MNTTYRVPGHDAYREEATRITSRFKHTLATALAGLFIHWSAEATIIDGGVSLGAGSFVKLTVPFTESDPDNTVGEDTFQTSNLYGFDEGQNIELTTDLAVNRLADGTGGGLLSGVLPAGTVVASHYIFFDPLGVEGQNGFVEFDSDVLGIISSRANLAASDFLINNGVTYLNPRARGLEAGDQAVIAGLRRINVGWAASSPGDFIRVLTAFSPGAAPGPGGGTIPAPATLALLVVGLVGMGYMRRKS